MDRTISPGSKPVRRTGSDLVEIRVVFQGLIGEETPQADIQLPEFNQGSTFPAADLVRDEIQKRIERFLPEVEIQGRQRRSEKQLLIANKTENTLNVFVHRRTNRLHENTYEWVWEPSDPGSRPQMLTIAPGKSEHESSVRLSPVVTRVPNVVGNSLNDAQTVLDERNDLRVRTIGDLLGRDRITGQNPQAGTEIERGESVVLDARVPTPSVRGANLFAASNQIRTANGELSPNIIGFSQGTDVVYSQNPSPGVLVMPRSTISLTPGVNIPSVSGLSINEARQRLANVNVNSAVTSSGTQETTNRRQVGQTVVNRLPAVST